MSHRRSCHRAATPRALRDTLPPLRTLSSSVRALRADAESSRSSSRPGWDRVRVPDRRTRASTGYRRALPRRPNQTNYTIAAGSRCATSRRSEMLDGRLEDPPSDNAARSLLPALTTAPPPPSPLETRRASCASSCPHNLASRSSAARPCCPLESKAQCAMIRRLIRGSLIYRGHFTHVIVLGCDLGLWAETCFDRAPPGGLFELFTVLWGVVTWHVEDHHDAIHVGERIIRHRKRYIHHGALDV